MLVRCPFATFGPAHILVIVSGDGSTDWTDAKDAWSSVSMPFCGGTMSAAQGYAQTMVEAGGKNGGAGPNVRPLKSLRSAKLNI